MIDRIKQIMEYYKLSPALLAEQIGINRSNLTHLFSGRNQPSLELAKKILHCFPEIKTEWLIMGVGEMMRSTEEKALNIKIQNEKQLLSGDKEPDLFTETQPQQKTVFEPAVESTIPSEKKVDEQIFDSKCNIEREEKIISQKVKEPLLSYTSKVLKIVFFYSDNSFEIFYPQQ
ncbi:MAG: helix-turn-helix transcriptional regulator [Bacteroidales bacterium]|jgi:DNA-binding XRE family transcriptional regulator|nr:helix-turn-helix transcriptional regulator [Bacteroidales bacterium]